MSYQQSRSPGRGSSISTFIRFQFGLARVPRVRSSPLAHNRIRSCHEICRCPSLCRGRCRKLIELANSVEAVQDGRIHIKLINGPMLFEYWAGLRLAIERGWLELDRSGTFVRFTHIFRKIREIANSGDRKPHHVIMEGVKLMLAKCSFPSLAEIQEEKKAVALQRYRSAGAVNKAWSLPSAL
jgi:hypothetical protein